MFTYDPKDIFFEAICGEEIAENLSKAILEDLKKNKIIKTNNKNIDLKSVIEKSIREKGPNWLKILIDKQDYLRVKH